MIVWRSRRKIHIFDLESGVRQAKIETVGDRDAELTSAYDPTTNYFYYTSHRTALFGLHRFRLDGYEPAKGGQKAKVRLPKVPTILEEEKE